MALAVSRAGDGFLLCGDAFARQAPGALRRCLLHAAGAAQCLSDDPGRGLEDLAFGRRGCCCPDVEPEDEIDAVEAEAAEMGEEGQGALDEELDQEVTEEAEAVGAVEAEDIVPDESAGDTETEEGPEIEVYEENQEEEADEPETSDEADEAKEETAGEEKAEDAAESVDDPLLARAKDANVNLDDLPGFRSSASSMDDTVVLKKLKNDNTVDLTSDME